MLVLDWSRTALRVQFRDRSITTGFEAAAFAAFDIFILRRPGAEGDYTAEQIGKARRRYENMAETEREQLVETVLLGLPGSMEAYSLEGLELGIRRALNLR